MTLMSKNFEQIDSKLINNKQINTISDYLEYIRIIRVMLGGVKLWYRGVSNIKYELTPSIYRPGFWPYSESTANDMFNDFIRRAKGLNSKYTEFKKWEWYQVQQHYGLPTRLLDWTEGSLIGLYFAVRNIRVDNSPAVWVIDPFKLNEISMGKRVLLFSDKLIQDINDKIVDDYIPGGEKLGKLPIAILPTYVDNRINSQKSTFTIHGSEKEGFEKVYIESSKEYLCVQLKINTTSAEVIKDELIRAGISEVTLFPDLEGLARELKYYHRMK